MVGNMTEATLDSKGRIVIPEKIRKKARLATGSKVRITLWDGALAVAKGKNPEEFIKEMRGIIKRGSPVEQSNPLHMKEIWRQD